ncbi:MULTISPECIES: pantoate--beta-alanine ligase [unclassified Hyphomicrobium]|uniref:pantoate--beta-alanine ligase n=1 Tax=unclassified Hyphomicrobium TaxID=2619925 RepID=UPI000213D333|nr:MULTISPECIES: pantoate--beta-alanine ligase [unclassified Hyphomicrobium]CCB64337.1 Pantoate--beta-alanine ligase (Pantothenate synthetase) (Pantoate-activating enzyme) [Hyphomicrobium sp. MC1]
MSDKIKIVRTVHDLRKAVAKWRGRDQTVGLVPTMGALHAGHISLVKLAKKKADKAVVSIFVNPTQFAANEDLSRYPRDEAGDLAKLAAADADLVWSPGVEEMYPNGFSTGVRAGSAAKDLEGAFRPGHFDGVATVCAKLFNQVTPDIAVFGEKDFQQLAVLRQMVRDLNMPLKLIGSPTKRDADGLALSSRNAYLSEAERKIAPALYAAISALAKDVANGADIPAGVADAKRKVTAAGFTKIDYIEVWDAETLEPASTASGRPMRVLAACWLGKTRLIDNVAA